MVKADRFMKPIDFLFIYGIFLISDIAKGWPWDYA